MSDRLVKALEELRAASIEVCGRPPALVCYSQGLYRNAIEASLVEWRRGHRNTHAASLITEDSKGRVAFDGIQFRVRFD